MSQATENAHPPAEDYLPVNGDETAKDAMGYAAVLVEEYGRERMDEVYKLVSAVNDWVQNDVA